MAESEFDRLKKGIQERETGDRIRDAERRVVGGLLLAGQAGREDLLADALPRLSDLKDEGAVLVVEAIRRRWNAGEAVDGELIAEDLEDRGELADAGGISYIVEAVNGCPSVEHLPEYVTRVRDLHREREREEIRARLADGDIDPGEAARRLEELEADDGAGFVAASSIEPEAVTWLWPRRLARGKVHLLDGDPGLGKSTLLLDLAARLSNGSPWPDAERKREPQTSLILSAEDGAADTVVPRLKASGADLERVRVRTPEQSRHEGPLAIPGDLPVVRQAVERSGAALVVFDPLMAYLHGAHDAHRDQDVRRALAPLADMAEETGAAVVLVRHLRKTGSAKAIYRGGGSIGIIGAARIGFVLGTDPDDESRRVLAPTKNNLSPPADSLAFRMVDRGDVAGIEWETAPVDLDAETVIQATEKETDKNRAKKLLREELSDGPCKASDLYDVADSRGIGKRTLKRASKSLGIEKDRREFQGPWWWSLPKKQDVRIGENGDAGGLEADSAKGDNSKYVPLGANPGLNPDEANNAKGDTDESPRAQERRDTATEGGWSP